ncbi:MAG: hypothetical protein ACI8RZ_007746 [Myxococcota bacterium]|jgi:hypothetical protein
MVFGPLFPGGDPGGLSALGYESWIDGQEQPDALLHNLSAVASPTSPRRLALPTPGAAGPWRWGIWIETGGLIW